MREIERKSSYILTMSGNLNCNSKEGALNRHSEKEREKERRIVRVSMCGCAYACVCVCACAFMPLRYSEGRHMIHRELAEM